uniref:Syndecan n=1 Tax=Mola mola TaxID=94237 RepID=A0A3Q3XF33_MOLML
KAAGAPLVVPVIPLSPPPFVVCQQVRETETWMPMKTEQTAATSPHRDALESSGSDFGFADDEDEDDSVGLKWVSCPREPSSRFLFCQQKHPDVNDNRIPDVERPARPTVSEVDIVRNSNEIPLLNSGEERPSNVLMSHASEDSVFSKTEVFAALIAGGAVGLMLAVLLVLFLIYRMKKKDEGSYDLGKKPIYKKAPTTEIYA